jgi:predicted amidohydrolase YtcJ
MSLVFKIIPPPSPSDRLRAATAALAEARRLGVTSVQDMGSPEDFATYQTLLKSGNLTCRIYALMPLPDWKRLADLGIKAAFGGDFLKIGGVKGFADGSLGSTTALFFEPYTDSPGTSGLPNAMMLPEGNMKALISGADKAGLQVVVHAIGDKANRIILDIFRQVIEDNGQRGQRFRIEHAQHIHPDDFRKFAELEVIASMQPYHAIDDGRWAEKRIGHERCKTTYAFRTLLDHKVKIAFGSDWSVAPLSPILGIYAAVTRRTLDGKNSGGWFPEQKISVAEALQAYTLTSAYASFDENIKGSIAPGKLADLAVLSHDLFSIAPEEIKNAYVLYTIVGGKIVYERKDEG